MIVILPCQCNHSRPVAVTLCSNGQESSQWTDSKKKEKKDEEEKETQSQSGAKIIQ